MQIHHSKIVGISVLLIALLAPLLIVHFPHGYMFDNYFSNFVYKKLVIFAPFLTLSVFVLPRIFDANSRPAIFLDNEKIVFNPYFIGLKSYTVRWQELKTLEIWAAHSYRGGFDICVFRIKAENRIKKFRVYPEEIFSDIKDHLKSSVPLEHHEKISISEKLRFRA